VNCIKASPLELPTLQDPPSLADGICLSINSRYVFSAMFSFAVLSSFEFSVDLLEFELH
jgi:hypothetical protein